MEVVACFHGGFVILENFFERHNGPARGLSSNHKFLHKSWSNYRFSISIKHWLQNLKQTSASGLKLKLKSWPNIHFITSPSLSSKILANFEFQNFAWTSTQLQTLDQTLCSKSEQSLALWPNLSIKICNKILLTWSSASTSATVTTSTSFEWASSHARVMSIKSTKRYQVS